MALLNLRIGSRIFLGFSFAAVLTLIVAVVSIYYLRNVEHRLTTVAEQDRLLQTSALELQVAAEQENNGVLSYLLSGQRSFLSQFSTASSQYSVTVANLDSLVQSAEDRSSLAEVKTLHQGFLDVANEQITLRDQGFPAAATFLWQTQGSDAKAALNDGLTRFISKQDAAISQRVSDAKSEQNLALAVSLTVVSLAWIAGIVGGMLLSRSITNPIQSLAATADAIGKGDLTVRTSIRGRDELASLASAINQMAQDLYQSRKRLEDLVLQERVRAEQMHAVVTGAPIVLFALDTNGVFTLSEGKGLGGLGLSPGELVGRSIFEVYSNAPEIVENVRHTFAGEEIADTVQVTGLTFQTRYSPVWSEDGEVIGVIGVATDITERIQAEGELLQQTQELAVLGERNRMAREIHDTLAQGFTGIVLQLEAAEQALEESPSDVQGHLDQARLLARESLQEARRSVWNLRPQALEGESLDAVLQEEVRQFASAGRESASFQIIGSTRELAAEVQAAFLRICQESLTNIRRHAGAKEVQVRLAYYPGEVGLSVRDDGVGFNLASPNTGGHRGFGLIGMQERARLLGGTLSVSSEYGKGTHIDVRIPAA